jgi:hypothetical protein
MTKCSVSFLTFSMFRITKQKNKLSSKDLCFQYTFESIYSNDYTLYDRLPGKHHKPQEMTGTQMVVTITVRDSA